MDLKLRTARDLLNVNLKIVFYLVPAKSCLIVHPLTSFVIYCHSIRKQSYFNNWLRMRQYNRRTLVQAFKIFFHFPINSYRKRKIRMYYQRGCKFIYN